MKKLALLLAIAFFQQKLTAQNLSGISTRWSDSFVEWDIFEQPPADSTAQDSLQLLDPEEVEPPKEELVGSLQLRWLNIRDDFSEWDYQLGEQKGTIRQRWKDDPSQWELRSYDGEVVTMRTQWPRDLTEWRVSDNSNSFIFKSRWTNQLDEWLCQDKQFGTFYLYTVRSRDPRDWVIEDRLDASVSDALRMAFIFLTVFHASPKQ